MKTIFVLIVLLFFCSVILGQEQIDSLVHKTKTIDPAYQHLIYDYRIPDWGYHRFYLGMIIYAARTHIIVSMIIHNTKE